MSYVRQHYNLATKGTLGQKSSGTSGGRQAGKTASEPTLKGGSYGKVKGDGSKTPA